MRIFIKHHHHHKQWKLHIRKTILLASTTQCGEELTILKSFSYTSYSSLLFRNLIWWFYHNIRFRYRCPLRNYDIYLSKKLCKWKGDIEDYVTHVKNDHPENFFEIQKYGNFKWKLPKYRDQQDIGIIKDKTDYYIFEMFYAHSCGKLYFSLNRLAEEPNKVTSYEFHLENASKNTPKYIQPINSANELVRPIQERSTTTKLCGNEIKECLKYYGHFTWKLILI